MKRIFLVLSFLLMGSVSGGTADAAPPAPRTLALFATAADNAAAAEFDGVLTNTLAAQPALQLVERAKLDAILKELIQIAGVVRHLAPFVKIKRNRCGALDALEPRCNVRGQHAQRAICTVDMKPALLCFGQVGQRAQVVNRADVNRTGRTDD